MQTRYLLELSLLTVGPENWRLRSLFVLKGGLSSEITELVRGRVWIDSVPTERNHNRGFSPLCEPRSPDLERAA